jgi:hypothetical protein
MDSLQVQADSISKALDSPDTASTHEMSPDTQSDSRPDTYGAPKVIHFGG